MSSRKLSIICFGLIVIFSAVSAFAQGGSFSDASVEYSFDLPDAKWKMTVKPSATNPNVEYVNGDPGSTAISRFGKKQFKEDRSFDSIR